MNSKLRFISIISLSFLVILSLGCKKSLFKKHAKGKVVDMTDQVPVPFAIVSFNSLKVNSQGGGGYHKLATTQCDKDGEFDIRYNTDGDNENYLMVDAEHYYSIEYVQHLKMDSENKKDQVIEISPKTSVLAHLNITDPNIQYVYFIMDHTDQNNNINAQPGITEKRYEVKGNQMDTYTYTIYYNNATTVTKKDSIFCPKFDKAEAVINVNL